MKETLFAFNVDEKTKAIAYPATPLGGKTIERRADSAKVSAGAIEVETYALEKSYIGIRCEEICAVEDDILSFISVPLTAGDDKEEMINGIYDALNLFDTIADSDLDIIAAKLVNYERDRDTIFVVLEESGFTAAPKWIHITSAVVNIAYNGNVNENAVVIVTCDHRVTEQMCPGCDILYI